MSKSELLTFLHEIGANPQKWLSQNFLIDKNIIAKVAELSDIQPKDKVLEIGPGPGAITKQLLAAGAKVVAIEKDPIFAEHLERLQTPDSRLEVVHADFLKFPLQSLGSEWKAVSNIPFKITAPILEKLCNHSSQFSSFTLVVQKEVADRIKAKPKTKEFGSLTLFLQFYTAFQTAFPILSTSFYPRPAVDATILHLLCREPPQGIDAEHFFPLMRKAFQQRRKMLTSSLRDLHPGLKADLEKIGVSAKARPEELSLEKWIQLFKIIY